MNDFKSVALEHISQFAKEKSISTEVVLPALIELIDRVRKGDVNSDLCAWDDLIIDMEHHIENRSSNEN